MPLVSGAALAVSSRLSTYNSLQSLTFFLTAEVLGSETDQRTPTRDRFNSFRYTITDTEEIKYEPAPPGAVSAKPKIKAASVRKLVEKITYARYPGNLPFNFFFVYSVLALIL